DLMVLRTCGPDTTLVEASDEVRAEMAASAQRFDAAGLTHLIAICDSVARTSKLSAHPRAMLDAAIVRLTLSEKIADVAALLAAGSAGGAVTVARNGRAPAKK